MSFCTEVLFFRGESDLDEDSFLLSVFESEVFGEERCLLANDLGGDFLDEDLYLSGDVEKLRLNSDLLYLAPILLRVGDIDLDLLLTGEIDLDRLRTGDIDLERLRTGDIDLERLLDNVLFEEPDFLLRLGGGERRCLDK